MPDKKSLQDKAKEAITKVLPDHLVQTAKSRLTDTVKESIATAVPDQLKGSAQPLIDGQETGEQAPLASNGAEEENVTEVEVTQEQEIESQQPSEPVSLKLALFGGAGIGLLFGVIMGMSVTPTVATVLGALTAMLAGILGLNDGNFSNAKAVRVGAFGFACVLGAFIGLYVRSHNSMAPSMMELKQEYVAVGFTEAQALAFIAQKTMGATLGPAAEAEPEPQETTEDGEQASEPAPAQTPAVTQVAAVQFNAPEQVAAQHSSLLFGAKVDISSCEEMENTDDTLPLDEVLNNFELTGDMWEVAYYWATENIAEAQQKSVMLAAKDAICNHDKIDQEVCKNITGLDVGLNGQQIAAEFAQNESWIPLAAFVDEQELADADKTQTLLLIKNTICGTL
jgi:hypothetical protein